MTSVLKIGSTRSGMSYSAISDAMRDALARRCALIVLDPHGSSLAGPLCGHLLAKGQRRRIRYDKFSNYRNVLDWRFLKPSTAQTAHEREGENEDVMRLFTSILCRQQSIGSLTTSPQKEEWVMNALRLYLHQKRLPGEDKLVYAFDPEHPEFTKLIRNCTCQTAVQPFLRIADGSVKQTELKPAQRLIKSVCGSPAFKVRCGGPGNFDFERFLDNKGILLVEGESKGNVSPEAMRAMFGAILLMAIRYVRTRKKPYPPVRIYLDEATNARLITTAEKEAAAECQKYGLDLIVMVQALDFPSTDITKGMLSNCVRHEWFWNANADQIKKAAEDLGGNRENDYISQLRNLKVGERFVKDRERIYRDRAPLLPDPFGLPGLTEKKIEEAIALMHQSSDYRNLEKSCPNNSSTTEIETMPSSPGPKSTPASPHNSETTSPADRLSIEDWDDSEIDDDDDCDPSVSLV